MHTLEAGHACHTRAHELEQGPLGPWLARGNPRLTAPQIPTR